MSQTNAAVATEDRQPGEVNTSITRRMKQHWFWHTHSAMVLITTASAYSAHNKWLRESNLLRRIIFAFQKDAGLKLHYEMPQPVCSHGFPRCKELGNA